MASGEMSSPEFAFFLTATLGLAAEQCRDGAIAFVCMDWRHMDELLKAVLVTELSDIPKTTFFDCDAVCYDYRAKAIYASPEYLPRLRARTIDINLLPNPSVEGNLLRAARRILLWGGRPGETLRTFIDEYLDEASFRSIADTEADLFQNPVTQAFDGAAELKAALLADRLTSLLNTAANEQLVLPGLRYLRT